MKINEVASLDTDLEVGPPYPKELMDVVKDMQRKLVSLGYPVGVTRVDGKYGMRTARAVRAWKQDNNIRPGTGFIMTVDNLNQLDKSKPKERPSWTANANSIQGSTAGDATPDMGMLDMIKGFESFQPEPYWDHSQWSVGYGSYAGSKDISKRPNIKVTEPEAEAMLKEQLTKYIKNVEKWNKVGNYNWNTGAKEALVSFAYNIGSIDQLTKNGTRDNATIAKKMLKYNKASGKVLKGLTRRRAVEAAKFVKNTQR